MRIKNLEFKNFKRFTNLIISDIPETSKLVLVIGSNGSGKSSLFDGFDWLNRGPNKQLSEIQTAYYAKNINAEVKALIEFNSGERIEKDGSTVKTGMEFIEKFIGRSSIRIVPKITNNANPTQILKDQDSPTSYIENDTRFINDVFQYIQQINTALREPVFSGQAANTLQIFRDYIEPLNTSLLNIFGGDETTTIQISEYLDASPNTPAKLIFKKGTSKINYDLLSHGEKQIVILLINFIVRQEYYKDSIIFIDEMDCHLNTALQSNLLQEVIDRWVPENAQLWTASHALGFIEYAQKSEKASILDFDLLNFDLKQEISPVPKDNLDVYEVAIPKSTIANILKGYKLIVVENKNDEHFNAALGQDGYLFLPANNNREVFLTVKSDKDKLGLRDRDYLRTDEVQKINAQLPNLKILHLSTFENYIYHPDNIAELNLEGFNRDLFIYDILQQKNEKLIDIVAEIGLARTHYIEFKDCILNDGNIKPITDALKSDVFEDFYPFFNMKKHFSKKNLSSFKYLVSDLSKTKWFHDAIINTIKG